MEGQTATPAAPPAAAQDDTQAAEPLEAPAPEQVAPPAAQPGPDKSTAEPDRRIQQAEFTHAQQAFSQLKGDLGLPRTATREEVIAAVQALRERPADVEDEPEPELDPDNPLVQRLQAAEENAWQSTYRYHAAIYGEGPVTKVAEFMTLARTTNDVSELMEAALDVARSFAAAQGEPGPAPEPEPSVAAGDIGLSEGDSRGPSARPQTAPGGQRGDSGVVGAVRGIFERAGGLTRPQVPPAR